MSLYRMKSHHRIAYLWWIVTCLVLQARQAGTPAAFSMPNIFQQEMPDPVCLAVWCASIRPADSTKQ